jgi:hypothetical protein
MFFGILLPFKSPKRLITNKSAIKIPEDQVVVCPVTVMERGVMMG